MAGLAATTESERLADRTMPAMVAAVDGVLSHFARSLGRQASAIASTRSVSIDELDGLFDEPVVKGAGDDLADVWTSVVAQAANATGYYTGSFELINPKAVAVAEREAARLVRGVRDESRLAIRGVVTDAVRGRLTTQEAATRIRSSAGLSRQQATALTRYRSALEDARAAGRVAPRGLGSRTRVADGLRGTEFRPTPPRRLLSPADVDRLSDRYQARLIRHRATVIARTEVMDAANKGLRLGWDEAMDAGLLDQGSTRRVWVVSNDDRTCPQCWPLSGQVVEYSAPFVSSELGAEGVDTTPRVGPPVIADMPPLHPQCRCTSVLEFDPNASPPALSMPGSDSPPPFLPDGEVRAGKIGDDIHREWFTSGRGAGDDYGPSYSAWRDHLADLPEGTRDQLSAYQSAASRDYKAINNALRTTGPEGRWSGGRVGDITEALDATIDAARGQDLPVPEVVYRGIGKGAADRIMKGVSVGDEIQLGGLQSSSATPFDAARFAGDKGVVFEIIPSAEGGAYIAPASGRNALGSELEWLMRHQSEFRVHSVSTESYLQIQGEVERTVVRLIQM